MSVIIQMWRRLDPSRTKKLSTSWVMILRLTGRGKVAHCGLVNYLFYSSICINSLYFNLFTSFYFYQFFIIYLYFLFVGFFINNLNVFRVLGINYCWYFILS